DRAAGGDAVPVLVEPVVALAVAVVVLAVADLDRAGVDGRVVVVAVAAAGRVAVVVVVRRLVDQPVAVVVDAVVALLGSLWGESVVLVVAGLGRRVAVAVVVVGSADPHPLAVLRPPDAARRQRVDVRARLQRHAEEDRLPRDELLRAGQRERRG